VEQSKTRNEHGSGTQIGYEPHASCTYMYCVESPLYGAHSVGRNLIGVNDSTAEFGDVSNQLSG
jgi:hypothetical protein